ncbi:MerR family transcriptional regulator [Amycolatopsis sp. NPDC051372]|uniref:MerR family transcriptional regulator n=1 Tax=Amycolatopsis sp. NPDC051372 TaxID=3155669 RepID=UPI003415B52B
MTSTQLSLVVVAGLAGVTYRQADYWCRKGFIVAPSLGSGNHRELSSDEAAVLHTMARLVAAGLAPDAAARVARQGDGRGRYELADGVHITLVPPILKGPSV